MKRKMRIALPMPLTFSQSVARVAREVVFPLRAAATTLVGFFFVFFELLATASDDVGRSRRR
jgi:hypothetical protein